MEDIFCRVPVYCGSQGMEIKSIKSIGIQLAYDIPRRIDICIYIGIPCLVQASFDTASAELIYRTVILLVYGDIIQVNEACF